MSRKQVCQQVVSEGLLRPQREVALESVDPVCVSSDPCFHRLVVLVNQEFEEVHEKVQRDVPVVALGPDFCGQLREGEALLGLVTGQEVAQRDGQEYYQGHERAVWPDWPVHGPPRTWCGDEGCIGARQQSLVRCQQ